MGNRLAGTTVTTGRIDPSPTTLTIGCAERAGCDDYAAFASLACSRLDHARDWACEVLGHDVATRLATRARVA